MRPRDAGTLIIIDSSARHPRILFGQRRADMRFAPGKYVFPGGSVDPADKRLRLGDELNDAETGKLLFAMKGRPSRARARALALAAVRETFEETGLVFGTALPADVTSDPTAPAWDAFLAHGLAPRIADLRLLARAITPPGRPRRFDARFFVVDAESIAARVDAVDAEFDRLAWATLDEARALELHGMTRAVLDDLADRIDDRGRLREGGPVPFYFQVRNIFRRVLIPDGAA